MTDLTSFLTSLKDFAWDVLRDIVKAAIIGAFLLVLNLFSKERQEQQKSNRIKNYNELVELQANLKDTMTRYSQIRPAEHLDVIITHLNGFLDKRIDYLKDELKIRDLSYGTWDKIFSNSFSAVALMCIIAMFAVVFAVDNRVDETRWLIAFVSALIIVGLGCYLNYTFGRHASEHLDSRFVRRLSQLVVSFAVSAICFIVGSLILVLSQPPQVAG
jgi:hypothetical protein